MISRDDAYLVPISRELAIPKHIIDRCQRLAIRVASSILIREVIVHEGPYLDAGSAMFRMRESIFAPLSASA